MQLGSRSLVFAPFLSPVESDFLVGMLDRQSSAAEIAW